MQSELASPIGNLTYKQCTVCRSQFTHANWKRLPLVGSMVVGPKVIGEMRNCPCGGSLTVEHDLTTTFGLLEGFAVLAEMLERGHNDILATAKAVQHMLKAVHP